MQVVSVCDPNNIEDLYALAHIILQFYGVLRISEVINLIIKDISFGGDENEQYAKINISQTKTDQVGEGRYIYINVDPAFPNNVDILKAVTKDKDPNSFYYNW